jgi:hypothetical protein
MTWWELEAKAMVIAIFISLSFARPRWISMYFYDAHMKRYNLEEVEPNHLAVT